MIGQSTFEITIYISFYGNDLKISPCHVIGFHVIYAEDVLLNSYKLEFLSVSFELNILK